MENPYTWGDTAGVNPVLGYQLDKPLYTPSGGGGTNWGGILTGIGALGEGVGNLIRGIRGELPAPMGMATSALSDYFNSGKQDSSLAILLEKLLREEKDDIDLRTKSGSTDISKVGGI